MNKWVRFYKLYLGESFYLGALRCTKRGWFTAYGADGYEWGFVAPFRRVKSLRT